MLEEALSWMRFPPMGKRGFGVNPTMVGYEARSLPEIIEHQNRETLAVVQFETTAAMERADELLSLKGLDVMMVGPADLSISLGMPGQFDHPLMLSTVDKLIEQCNPHGWFPEFRRAAWRWRSCGRSAGCASWASRRSTRCCWRRRRRPWRL